MVVQLGLEAEPRHGFIAEHLTKVCQDSSVSNMLSMQDESLSLDPQYQCKTEV